MFIGSCGFHAQRNCCNAWNFFGRSTCVINGQCDPIPLPISRPAPNVLLVILEIVHLMNTLHCKVRLIRPAMVRLLDPAKEQIMLLCYLQNWRKTLRVQLLVTT